MLLDWLLGRLVDVADRSEDSPDGVLNDRRLMCEVDDLPARMLSSSLVDDVVLLLIRFRVLLRIVMALGTELPEWAPNRGEPLGVGAFGGGSLERTECTLSSIFCIRPIKPLI